MSKLQSMYLEKDDTKSEQLLPNVDLILRDAVVFKKVVGQGITTAWVRYCNVQQGLGLVAEAQEMAYMLPRSNCKAKKATVNSDITRQSIFLTSLRSSSSVHSTLAEASAVVGELESLSESVDMPTGDSFMSKDNISNGVP